MLTQAQGKALYSKGLKLVTQRRFFAARDAFAEIAKDYPRAAEAWFQIGKIDKALGRPLSAAYAFERAMKIRPDEKEIIRELEAVAGLAGRADFAVDLNRKLLKMDRNDVWATVNLGTALQQDGKFDEADKVFRKAIKTWPRNGICYGVWFRTHKFKSPGDPALRQALKVWEDQKLPDLDRQRLGFALAKAMEDLGEYDRVFPFLRPANEIGKRLYPYDRAERRQMVQGFLDAGSEKTIARNGSSDFAPIFVIGNPRSGTTLTEQIIAAHPEVHAGGEIAKAMFLHNILMTKNGNPLPLAQVKPENMASFVQNYEISAREHAQTDGVHVTDKSIQNNLIIGWLAAAFPKARFIVVRRDRHDVALSIYKNFFRLGRHNYAYDLADIASVLRNYDRSIEHWRDRVDLLEVDYDELTADPEPQSRRLIAGAGLDWHDDCLEFHAKKNTVRTLSLAQVRQPIYKSSSGGWRRYESDLAPFIEAWDREV